jgi:excisionase family DNA binding protein
MGMQVAEELVTVKEAAKESKRNMETVRRWIWSGKLPAQKLGNQLFIKRSELRAFLDRLSVNKRGAWDKLEAIERAEALQKRIRAKTGTNFDISALIEESRQRHNL